MTTLLGIRKVLFAAPLLAAAAAWSISSVRVEAATPAAAGVTTEAVAVAEPVDLAASNCTYYSNASRTQVVGQFGFDCCNNPVSWGKKTKFSVCGGCFPCVPPPR